jgi:hypothetical protein
LVLIGGVYFDFLDELFNLVKGLHIEGTESNLALKLLHLELVAILSLQLKSNLQSQKFRHLLLVGEKLTLEPDLLLFRED